MQAANIGVAILTKINVDTNAIGIDPDLTSNVSTGESLSAEEVIKKHTGKHGSVCFVVRRPG